MNRARNVKYRKACHRAERFLSYTHDAELWRSDGRMQVFLLIISFPIICSSYLRLTLNESQTNCTAAIYQQQPDKAAYRTLKSRVESVVNLSAVANASLIRFVCYEGIYAYCSIVSGSNTTLDCNAHQSALNNSILNLTEHFVTFLNCSDSILDNLPTTYINITFSDLSSNDVCSLSDEVRSALATKLPAGKSEDDIFIHLDCSGNTVKIANENTVLFVSASASRPSVSSVDTETFYRSLVGIVTGGSYLLSSSKKGKISFMLLNLNGSVQSVVPKNSLSGGAIFGIIMLISVYCVSALLIFRFKISKAAFAVPRTRSDRQRRDTTDGEVKNCPRIVFGDSITTPSPGSISETPVVNTTKLKIGFIENLFMNCFPFNITTISTHTVSTDPCTKVAVLSIPREKLEISNFLKEDIQRYSSTIRDSSKFCTDFPEEDLVRRLQSQAILEQEFKILNEYNSHMKEDSAMSVLLFTRNKPSQDNTIEASYVRDMHGRPNYIFCAVPKLEKASEFWALILSENVNSVLWLTTDEGLTSVFTADKASKFDNISVMRTKFAEGNGFTLHSLDLLEETKGTPRRLDVNFYKFYALDDKGLPSDRMQFAAMLSATCWSSYTNSGWSPKVIICRTGLDLSAIAAAVESCMLMSAELGKIDVFKAVQCIQRDRPNSIKKFEYYKAVYQIMAEHLVSKSCSEGMYNDEPI